MFLEHVEQRAANTLLAAHIRPIPAFGRLIRDQNGQLIRIVEHSACTPQERQIDEVNVGIQVLDAQLMWRYLDQIDNKNPKGEYYLTGIIDVMARDGLKQHVVHIRRLEETWGVNTLADLLRVEKELRRLEENAGG